MVCLTVAATQQSAKAQVIRAYGNPVFSDNIRGGHTIFGNTITAVYTSGSGSTGVVNSTAMNDFSTSGTGNYSNGRTSAYGNDNANIQFTDVDGGGSTASLLAYGGMWRYYSQNNYSSAPANISGLNWTEDAYNDASNWTNTANNSNAFGYNEPNVNAPSQTNRETYYLRRDINITNPAQYSTITLTAKYDDGAVVYVNGVEVARMNMPTGTLVYGTNPGGNRNYTDGDFVINIPSSSFTNGNNQVAVALYQGTSNTVDLYFDMKLDGNTVNATFNSSSADLVMPSGTNTVRFARLYWGGRIDGGTGGSGNINLRTVKIRKGTSGAYTNITAPVSQVDKSLITGSDSAYQSYIDLTAFVNSNGAGTYTVADITVAVGSASGGGNYGGWAMVVVYENQTVSYSSVRVYDGFIQVFSGGSPTSQSILLTGLNAPGSPVLPSDAYMSTVSWEGDANLAASGSNPNGDYIKVNGNVVSNTVNPGTNFWNGTISKNGSHVSTKNPNFLNQMGIDIDEQEVGTGYGIPLNATEVAIEFGTEADQYFPSVFAFTIKAKDPEIILNKSVSDGTAPFGTLQTNEILTYTLSGSNVGQADALSCTVVDTIPYNVSYVPGSLIVVNAPGFPGNSIQTDANDTDFAYKGTNGGKDFVKFYIGTGATNSSGGVLKPGETYTLRFQVSTPSTTDLLSTVINTARITGENAFGDQFVDDGTASIALGSPTPVKMSSFTVKKESNDAVLRWTTVSETKNDHFDIERSVDGINFTKMGTVAGNGTTVLTKNYIYPDALANVASKILYYRLRIVDMDGKSTFSTVVALRLDGSIAVSSLTVYPNPFTSNIKLQLRSAKEENSTIRFINARGQEVLKRNVTLMPGDNIVVVGDLQTVAPGLYIMELRTGNDVITQRIIKQ
ncbi:MAG: T9SS type A sorting domain-containing protein [Ferruginibacter sp.]|nr:T9SS type A sorting domain-containing protein [Ferruginibacter sp.]MBU9936115.1 T9SS type A sorting domain-containing protein [Ferruginibacter sp.]